MRDFEGLGAAGDVAMALFAKRKGRIWQFVSSCLCEVFF
jgi:hypothetical protein